MSDTNVIILGVGRTGQLLKSKLEDFKFNVLGTNRKNWQLGKKIINFSKEFESSFVIGTLPPSVFFNDEGKIEHSLLPPLIEQIKPKRIIWMSSTSVYSNKEGLYTEGSNELNKKSKAYQLEMLLGSLPCKLSLVRCAGLIDYNSHPARSMAKREICHIDHTNVNLVHREDVARIIFQLVKSELDLPVVNAVTPQYPSKIFYYTMIMNQFDLSVSRFQLNNNEYYERKVSSEYSLSNNLINSYRNLFDFSTNV